MPWTKAGNAWRLLREGHRQRQGRKQGDHAEQGQDSGFGHSVLLVSLTLAGGPSARPVGMGKPSRLSAGAAPSKGPGLSRPYWTVIRLQPAQEVGALNGGGLLELDPDDIARLSTLFQASWRLSNPGSGS